MKQNSTLAVNKKRESTYLNPALLTFHSVFFFYDSVSQNKLENIKKIIAAIVH